jgi:hypothetical protein
MVISTDVQEGEETMPKKLTLTGFNGGETIDHYHQLDLTLEQNADGAVEVAFLVTTGTVTVDIDAPGSAAGSFALLDQLAETDNVLTTITITGNGVDLLNPFGFGNANTGDGVVTDIAATATTPTTIHSSLSLIDASATTGQHFIFAGATNTSSPVFTFLNGSTLNSNITITYDGLTILGGSGRNIIENDANDGVVIQGNHASDVVILAGAGASTILGTGANDQVTVGATNLGTNEDPGKALGETVTFGAGATAELFVGGDGTSVSPPGFPALGEGAEAGPNAGIQNGQTNVNGAAAGMLIDFHVVTTSSTIADETNAAAVLAAATLTAKENAAVVALGGPGVAYVKFDGDEYFISTNTTETAGVGFNDAVVHLVGVQFSHPANSGGIVTLG